MKNFWFSLVILVAGTASAQTVDLSNPRSAYRTFYENLDQENPDVSSASKIITYRHLLSKSKREEYVVGIKRYLDQNQVEINIDSLSNDDNYLDSVTTKNQFRVSNIITLEKIGSHWYFSKETVNAIPALAKGTSDVAEEEPAEDEEGGILRERQREKKQREAELQQIATMPVNLSTPYDAIKLFIENAESSPAKASRIIAVQHIPNMADRIDIIEKLRRFFDGKGVIIDLDKVPEDPNFTDSLHTAKYTYEITYRFSDIYLEKEGKNWMLSKESAEKIPSLYSLAFPFGSDRLLKYLPTEGRIEFFGLFAWQYLAILIIVILTYLTFKFLNWSISFLVTRILFRFGYKDVAKTYVLPVVRPIGLLIAFIMAETATPFLQLPLKATAFLAVTVEILIPFFATVAFYHSVNLVALYMEKLAGKTENTFDDQLVPLIRKILKTFVVIIGAVIIIQQLGGDIKLLLGTLSVGGLALALAAQDTIKNFFGSLMIFIDKPFQAGHWVTTNEGLDGTVEQVGFRSTRIRTFTNSVITIPNGRLSDNSIDNHGLRAYRRFKTHIAVTYDTPPDLLELFIEGLREIVDNHPHTRKDMYHVYMNDMGSHSLNILFYIFFITPEWGKELQYRHEVIIAIMKLAETLGIRFAFPTQTLHMEDFPGQESLSPKYMSRDQLEEKMQKFLAERKQEKSSDEQD